jgi:peptidoglycan/LPS O-acetylase OafA/YrhL
LRAVAVGLVVAYHAGIPGFSGGFIGVDVFFVISGFLITRLLLDDATRHGTIDLADFYARRVRRILPALIVVVVFAMAVMPLVSFTGAQVELASASAMAAIFFYSNFFFWNQAESYFAPQLELLPLLHTWSLAIEEQFYMVWPLALLALAVAARRLQRDVVTLSARFFVAVLLASLAFSIWSTGERPIAAFYLMPSRAWELATGALLVVNATRFHAMSERMRTALRVAGLTGIVAAAMLYSPATAFPGTAAIVPVLSTALVIASVENAAGGRGSLLASRPMVFVGLLSYSWYLWHWTLLALRRLSVLGERSLAWDALACAVGFALAYLTYRFVETPVRTMRFVFLRRHAWTFAFGAALCFAGYVAAEGAGIAALYRAPSRLADAAADKPPLQGKCALSSGKFSGTLVPEAVCRDGDPGGPVAVVVWGDSHASHLMPMVGELLRAHQLSAVQRTLNGCPPLISATTVGIHRGVNSECTRFNATVLAELAARTGLRGVVLGSRWTSYLATSSNNARETFMFGTMPIDPRTGTPAVANPTVGVAPLDAKGSALTLERSLRDTFAHLKALGLSVMVNAPTPTMPSSVPECLARKSEQVCSAPRAVVEEHRATALAAVRAAAAGFDHVALWDPIDRLCNADTCFSTQNGVVVYSDDDHFTATWSRRLAIDAAPMMARLILK